MQVRTTIVPRKEEVESSRVKISSKRAEQQNEEPSGTADVSTSHPETAVDPVATAESAPSDTIVNDEYGGDFTDEEVDVDAEVCTVCQLRLIILIYLLGDR